jgi:hypothetical protein
MRRLLPLALLAAAACIDDLAPQYRVTDLRILAVRAEAEDADGTRWADAAPGATLRLEALVVNPLDRGPLEVSWYACVPTGTAGVSACLDEAVLRDPDRLGALAADPRSGVVVVGSGSSPDAIPLEPWDAALDAALDAVDALAAEQPTYLCRAYVEIPVAVVAEAEGRREIAVKRVRITRATSDPDADYVRNGNPVIGRVLRAASEEACAGGLPVAEPPFPAGRSVLCGISAHPPERYNVCGPAGEHIEDRESLDWQWFVTAGEFPEMNGIGNATGSAPEFEPPPGPFTLWAVLRDGRGGVAAWQEFAGLAVAP